MTLQCKPTPAQVVKILEKGYPLFKDEIRENYRRLGRHRFVVEEYHNGKWLAEPIRTLDGVWGTFAKTNLPTLVRYIDEFLPGCRLSSFSELLPGAIVKPHNGVDFGMLVNILSRRDDWPFERFDTYFSGRAYEVFRFHLCIHSPSSDFALLGLRSGNRQLTWQDGRCIYFDDTVIHEAWNRTDSARQVLIMDLMKDDLNLHSDGRDEVRPIC